MAYEAMVHHIHSMVDKAKSLGDQPSMEELYMSHAMVRDKGERCLTYVQEADKIHVQADYRRDEVQDDHVHSPLHKRGKGGVSCRRERAAEKGHVFVDQATSENDQAATNYNIGSTSRGHTQEFTQVSSMTYQPVNIQIVPYMTPQTPQFENAPDFNSSPVQMSIHIPEAINGEDSNDEVDDNDSEDVGEGQIFRKHCRSGSYYLDHYGKSKKKYLVSRKKIL